MEKYKIMEDGTVYIKNPDGTTTLDDTSKIISNIPKDEKDQFIKTLVIGCRIAQEKGVYTLEEARTIMNAIDFLNSNEEK